MREEKTIALIGNPNSGKTSLFNLLTGMHQHTSNFPGTTISVKSGYFHLDGLKDKIRLIDFPGAYSFFANSIDEQINVSILTNPGDSSYPDLVVYVVDVAKLSRHFLLASQVIDLKIPVIVVLNMIDLIDAEDVDVVKLQKLFSVPIILMSTRTEVGLSELHQKIEDFYTLGKKDFIREASFYQFDKIEKDVIASNQQILACENPYLVKLRSHHVNWLNYLNSEQKEEVKKNNEKVAFDDLKYQIRETMNRYDTIGPTINAAIVKKEEKGSTFTDRIDNVITHRIFGPFIFAAIMLFIFQAIFSWATPFMDVIEGGFSLLSSGIRSMVGENWFANLLVEGVIPGLAGVFVFLPQIIMLFFFLAVLEESGYMSRVVYMFDGLLAKFGLNGRSIVTFISSGACAIPAIMSTRTISNFKERLITIMVTPLISCSARIPVYTALIGFVVPSHMKFGIFNAQGLAFMGLYLLGVVAALMSALVFKWIVASSEQSFLMMEMPEYKKPIWKNVFYYVSTKVMAFIKEAGKIILLVSVILWFMASYGPSSSMSIAEKEAYTFATEKGMDKGEISNYIASKRLEASYAGILGKLVEPLVKPLGYDWKMGIALITSFAAREVFVGTMSTIYSIGGDDDVVKVRDRMSQQVNPLTGEKVYSFATSLSLLMFYVFALMCLSTLAVTYKETNSLKWTIVQFTYTGVLAYVASFLVYNIFV